MIQFSIAESVQVTRCIVLSDGKIKRLHGWQVKYRPDGLVDVRGPYIVIELFAWDVHDVAQCVRVVKHSNLR